MKDHWVRRAAVFLSGQTITLFGSCLVQYAISWHITLTTQSGLMLTIATLCGFLPQVLISLFAGVWADRFSRKKLIIIADATIALCTAVLAVLFTAGYTELWLLFFISAVRSLGAGVQMPAVTAFLTELVPQDKLMRVNGINASIQSVMMLGAPAAAGGLYAVMGLSSIFWVDVITAAMGITLLVVLKTAPRIRQTIEEHFFKDMLLGVKYVAKTKWLKQLLIFYLFFSLLFGPAVFLTPLMVARSFGAESWRLVAHEMIFALGSIVGGVTIGLAEKRFKNKMAMLVFACCAFGLTTAVMGFSFNFVFYLAVMFFTGITMPYINTGAMTVLQTRVEPDLMGRVFSLVSIIGSGAMPLSMVFFGPLGDAVKIEYLLIITGVLMIGTSLMIFRCKALMQAGEPIEAAAE